MPLLTPEQLRAYVESDLPDSELEEVIATEAAYLDSHVGTMDQQVEYHTRPGHDQILLRRYAEDITSVVEDGGTLGPDEYQITGRRTLRLVPRRHWRGDVVVTYTPFDDSPLRRGALISLCQINLATNGYIVLRNPEIESRPLPEREERRRIVDSLKPGWLAI